MTGQYPFFEKGQTLTASDLNLVRGFLHARDRLIGRMTGFGVNCGLGGSVEGAVLTIQPGLAVDQLGEPLVLSEALRITLPPPPTPATPAYDFIDADEEGFSVVLEATDVTKPAPDCGEGNCAGHAELHTVDVAVHTVAGRVTGTRMDFANEELLNVHPLVLALDSTLRNSYTYTELRNKLDERLTNGTKPLVDPALIAKMKATSIDAADTPGVQGYKSGWLNMVLFATLDLLRARALAGTACDRTTARPGVVLGRVRQTDGGWVFDCSHRHAWEPPCGLTQAFLGGTCTDPVGVHRDELEALLAGFAPPAPVPQGTVTPQPVHCPKGSILINGKCVNIYYPPEVLPEKWSKPWKIDPLVPVWYPPHETKWKEPWKVYETEGWDRFDDGVIGATPYLGRDAVNVEKVLREYITAKGGVPDVRVVTVDALQRMTGYLASGGFSPSDTIVLTKDDAGNVIASGRVPALRNTRDVGTALPAAVKAAADAEKAAVELRGLARSVETHLGTVEAGLSQLKGEFGVLHHDFQAYKGGAFDISGYGVRITKMEQRVEEINDVDRRISLVEGKVNVLTSLRGGGVKVIDPTLGTGIAEFARTTVEAMRSLPEAQGGDLREHTELADRARAELETALAAEDPAAVNQATLAVLDTVRTMVKASGAGAEHGLRLDVQLRNLSGLIR